MPSSASSGAGIASDQGRISRSCTLSRVPTATSRNQGQVVVGWVPCRACTGHGHRSWVCGRCGAGWIRADSRCPAERALEPWVGISERAQ